MVLFNGENLFDSGPHRLHVGGLSLRHVLHESHGARGVRLISQGTGKRTLKLRGFLLADTEQQLRELTRTIESKLTGQCATLRDNAGNDWPDIVMTRFELQGGERVGPRYRIAYTIEFTQVQS